MANYSDGSRVMDEHVTADNVADLSAEIERLQARINGLTKVIDDHCIPNAAMRGDFFLTGLLAAAVREQG